MRPRLNTRWNLSKGPIGERLAHELLVQVVLASGAAIIQKGQLNHIASLLHHGAVLSHSGDSLPFANANLFFWTARTVVSASAAPSAFCAGIRAC